MELSRKRFDEVFDLQLGRTPARGIDKYWGGTNTWVSIADMGHSKYISSSKECITDAALVETGIPVVPNDVVIMSFKLSIGKVAITSRELYTNEAIMAFIPKPGTKILNDYLYYYLQGYKWDNSNNVVLGFTLNKKSISSSIVSYPSLPEQQRIVDILDQEFAKIDALKANAEKSVQAAEDLFLHLSNGFFELSFPVSKLGNECDFVRGPFGGSLKKSCFKPSGYPVYEQQHAIYSRFTFRYFVDEDKYKEMRRFSVLPGDLIMSCSGTIGKVAIIPDDAPVGIINQALLKLTTKERLLPEYLKWYMQSLSFEKSIQKHSKGAAIQNVASVAVLKEITIPVPPIEQQRKIVVALDDLNDRCNILQDNHKKTIALCDDLKQALLRKAFNGEL